MARSLKDRYADTKPIAVCSLVSGAGLLVLKVHYDITDKVLVCSDYHGLRDDFRWHKIYTTTTGRNYIRKFGQRFYMEHFIHV